MNMRVDGPTVSPDTLPHTDTLSPSEKAWSVREDVYYNQDKRLWMRFQEWIVARNDNWAVYRIDIGPREAYPLAGPFGIFSGFSDSVAMLQDSCLAMRGGESALKDVLAEAQGIQAETFNARVEAWAQWGFDAQRGRSLFGPTFKRPANNSVIRYLRERTPNATN